MKYLLFSLILLIKTSSSNILELRLNLNFGEVFHDFSDSSNFCENGISFEDLLGNTKLSSLGAYFSSTEDSLITLPPNKVQPSHLQLPPTFKEALWIKLTSFHSHQILLSKHSESFNFSLVFNSSNLGIFTSLSNSLSLIQSFYSKSSNFSNHWNLIILEYSKSSVTLQVNLETILKVSLLFPAQDFSRVSLGAERDSLKGFIYRFSIVSLLFEEEFSEFYSQIALFNEKDEIFEETCKEYLGWAFGKCLECEAKTCFLIDRQSHPDDEVFSKSCGKSKFYSFGIGCVDCDSLCEDCLPYGKCTKCKDLTFLLDGQGKCSCFEGSFLDQGNCLLCSFGCEKCENFEKCLSCKKGFTKFQVNYGFFCKISRILQGCEDGFYLDSMDKCQKCQESCKKCMNFTYCIECSVVYSSPVDGVCECLPGFYKEGRGETFECAACLKNCSTCENNFSCSSCLTEFSNLVNGNCECPENSYESSKSCIPIAGYFMTQNQTSNTTEKCHKTCKSCKSSSAESCIECINNIKKSINLCSSCESGKYLDSLKCYDCSEDCLECKSHYFCLKCKNDSLEPLEGLCKITCSKGFFSSNGECHKCPSLCLECIESQCLICQSNSFYSNGQCKCAPGFFNEQEKCVDKFFYGKLTETRGLLKLVFSEEVVGNFTLDEVEIERNGKKVDKVIMIKAKHGKEFLFYLKSDIKGGKNGKIELFIKKMIVFSNEDSKLKDYGFQTNSSIVEQADYEIFFESVKNLIRVLMVLTFGTGFFTDFSVFWAFVYFVQIISYSSLTANELTPHLKIFMKKLYEFNIVPNLFIYIFDSQSCSHPGNVEKNFGIETSVFFLNIGKNLLIFLVGMAFWMVLSVVCIGEENEFYKKIKKYRETFKTHFLLRSLTLLYLDLGIHGIIQYKSVTFTQEIKSPSSCYPNMISGYMGVVILTQILVLLTVPAIISFMINSRLKITQLNQDFLKSWSFFFEEFSSTKGILSFQFYLIFFSRRLIFILSHMLLNDYLVIQGGANIFGSLICLGYLVYFRPFTDVYLIISNIFLEADYLLVCIFSYSLLWDFDESSKDVLEKFVFGLSFLGIFFISGVGMVKFGFKGFNTIVKVMEIKKSENQAQNRVMSGVSFATFEANTIRNI